MNEDEVVSYRYDPYGAVTITVGGTPQSSDPLGNPWMYTARFHDEESGLEYYRARYYSSSTGRFLQRDPMGQAAGPNLYEYSRSRPSQLRDPVGLHPDEPKGPTMDDLAGESSGFVPWWLRRDQLERFGRMCGRHFVKMHFDLDYRAAYQGAEAGRKGCFAICETERAGRERDIAKDYSDALHDAAVEASKLYAIAYAGGLIGTIWGGPWAIVIATGTATAVATTSYEGDKADADRQKRKDTRESDKEYRKCMAACRKEHPMPGLI